MILWFVFSIITFGMLVLLLLPLLRCHESAATRVDYDAVVYRDQLAEVESDYKRGVLSAEDVNSTRTEIMRRMLVAGDADTAFSQVNVSGVRLLRRVVACLIMVLVPVATMVLYSHMGAPELPSQPFAEREKNDPDFVMTSGAEQLSAKLKVTPDSEGFARLGETLLILRRYQEAAEAYHHAIELGMDTADIWSQFGESVVMASAGNVGRDALSAFMHALKRDSGDARARFYMGIAKAQVNKTKEAVAIWRDLLNDSPADAIWIGEVKEQIAAYAKQGGFDPEMIQPKPPSLVASDYLAGGTEIDSSLAETVLSATPEQQKNMIHGMVEKLEAKLHEHPDDIQGWEMLARSYRTLGKLPQAKEAEKKVAALKVKAAAEKKDVR